MACPGVARASSTDAGPRIEIGWTAPEACGPASFTQSLDALLADSEVDAWVRIDAVVVQEDDGWRVDAWFQISPDRDGRRSFRAPACATVSQAAALALAIAVDPTVLARVDEDLPAKDSGPQVDEAVPEPEAELAVSTPDELEAPSRPGDELGPIEPYTPAAEAEPSRGTRGGRVVIGAGARIDGVALPGPGFGGALRVGVLLGRLRAELEGTYRAPTRGEAPDRPEAGGRFQQWTVGALGCFVPQVGPVQLPLCGGIEGGQTIAEGYGWRRSQVARRPWLAATGRGGLVVPLGSRLALVADGSLAVPLLRPAFEVVGVGPVYRVGAVQVRGLLGLELRLP